MSVRGVGLKSDTGAQAQKASNAAGVGRQRQHLADQAVVDPEEEHLVEIEPPAVALAGGAVQRGRPVVAREHVDELRGVRPAGLFREPREEAEDRLATAVDARHHPVAGHDPHRIGSEQVAEREALLLRERAEDPADDLLVRGAGASGGHGFAPTRRSAA